MKKKYIILLGVIIAVIALGFVLYKYSAKILPNKTSYAVIDFPQASTILDDETITQYIETLNGEYKKLGQQGYNEYGLWLNIGILKKSLQDFKGAEHAWWQATLIDPDTDTALGNLADLNLYFIRDYQKAESFYKEALLLNTTNYNYYEGLAVLYRFEIPEKMALVEQVMNEGATNNPSQTLNYYLYLVDYFDNEGNNPAKLKEYINKIKALDPAQEILDALQSYEDNQET